MLNVWQRYVTDDEGNVIDSPEIEVRDEDSGDLVLLYSDVEGDNAIGNPFTGGADGFVQFYTTAGRFSIKVTKNTSTSTFRYVQLGSTQSIDAGEGVAASYETKSALESANVPSTVDALYLQGYASAGDGGGALYKRVASEPSHAGKIQSGDGAWWELAEPVVTPQMFGSKGDAINDDGVNITSALEYCFTKEASSLFFPAGQYFCVTQASVTVSNDEHEIGIYGEGKPSQIFSANNDGAIKIESENRRTRVDLRNISINPAVSDAGTAFEFTTPEGGLDNRQNFSCDNLFIDGMSLPPTDFESDPDNMYFNDPLILTGLNRPRINGMTMSLMAGDKNSPSEKRYALIDLDGCYGIRLSNILLIGTAERGITNVRSDENEGGRYMSCNVNGSDIGIYISQPNRHPSIHFINTHVNAVEKGLYIENSKFIYMSNLWLYTRGEADPGEMYTDIHLVGCDHVVMDKVLWRGSSIDSRRHVHTEDSRDVFVDARGGLAATVTSAPFLFDTGSEDCELILPRDTADYDNADYPSSLVQVGAGVTCRVYRGDQIEWYGYTDEVDTSIYRRDADGAGDAISTKSYIGRNDAGSRTTYSRTQQSVFDPTAGSEHGFFDIEVMTNGSLERLLRLIRANSDDDTGIVVAVRESGVYNTYRVSVGAEDSGGSGFRQLVIPNL